MNSVLHNLMAAVLLLHAVLGCCWHHALACHEVSAEAATPACCCGHHHETDAEHGDRPAPPSSDCPRSDCPAQCEGTCVYLPAQKSNLDISAVAFAADAMFAPAIVATVPGLVVPAGKGFSWQLFAGTLASGPPVRLHLLHQSLLI